MNVLNRRGLIKSVACLPVAGIAVTASPVDPHPQWLRDWRKACKDWGRALSPTGDDTPESERIWDRRDRLEDLISQTEAMTAEGAAAQIAWVIENSDGDFAWRGVEEALRSALRTLS